MGFRRGGWRCEGASCSEDAELAFVVMVSTPGKRGVRRQKSSTTVRLCKSDIKELCKGKAPAVFLAAIDSAVKEVRGER
jgi:hypothetical protein